MNFEKFIAERQIYGILDWLGNVGGLADALIYISLIIMFITKFQPAYIEVVSQLYRYRSRGLSQTLSISQRISPFSERF